MEIVPVWGWSFVTVDVSSVTSGGAVVMPHLTVIRDRGTGLGATIADRLGLTEPPEAALGLVGGGPGSTSRNVPDGGADDVPGAAVLAEVELVPGPSAAVVTIRIGAGGTWETWPTEEVPDRILAEITRRHLDGSRHRSHLHAGAVVDAEGRALVCLGSSGAGKSTLIAHLAASGLHLISDEQVQLHPEVDLISGFTRPLAIKPGGLRALPATVEISPEPSWCTRLVSAAELGSAHALTGRPRVLAAVERDPALQPGEVLLAPLGPTAAVEVLCANNLDLERNPRSTLEAFARIATTCTAVSVRHREASDACSQLRAVLAGAGAAPTGSTPAGSDEVPPRWWWVEVEPGPVARLAEGVLVLAFDDGAIAYEAAARLVVRLSPQGRELLEAIAGLTTWAALPEEDRADLRLLAAAGVVTLGEPVTG